MVSDYQTNWRFTFAIRNSKLPTSSHFHIPESHPNQPLTSSSLVLTKQAHLDEEELDEYKEAFSLFDKNKDNQLSPKELQETMRYLGNIYSDGEIIDMIKEVGGNWSHL